MDADGRWFVMMYSQNGEHVMPLVDEYYSVFLFDSKREAKRAGNAHPFASEFGFFVRQVGGEYV